MEVTFILEDGSGVTDATSYSTLDAFKQYWFDREYTYGTLTDNDLKRLLNKASAYVDNNYRRSFPGYKQYNTQGLEWPRSNAYYLDNHNNYDIDEDTIPPEVKNAVYEAAYLLFGGEDLTATISKSGKVVKSEIKVDVIEESIEYEDGSTMYSDIYTIIDQALSRITGGVSDRYVLRALRVGGESP